MSTARCCPRSEKRKLNERAANRRMQGAKTLFVSGMLAVMSFDFIGDSLRDALDPRLRT